MIKEKKMDKIPGSVVEAFEPDGEDKLVLRRTREDGTSVEFTITLNQLTDFILGKAEDALVTENGESLETYSSHRKHNYGY